MWDDRFHEEPDYKGPLCPHCDAPISEDNPRETIEMWTRRRDNDKLMLRKFDGCRFDRQIQCFKNAILFLEDEILHYDESGNEPCPGEAIMELCDGSNLTYPKEML